MEHVIKTAIIEMLASFYHTTEGAVRKDVETAGIDEFVAKLDKLGY